MAFATKYRVEFKDLHGLIWQIDFQEDDFAGAVTDLTPSANPLVIRWEGRNDDLFEPVKESFAEITVITTTNFSLADLYAVEDQHFKVLIYYGSSDTLYWQGWVDTRNYSEPYEDIPYPVTITATDGLSLLKEYEYVDGSGDYYDGRILESQIVIDVLGKIGYTAFKEYCNIYEGDMMTTADDSPFDQVMIDADVFRDGYCYEVLQEICKKYGAVLMQKDGVFCFYRPTEMGGASVTGRSFTAATTKTSITLAPEQQIRRSGSNTDRIQVPGGVKMIQRPASKVIVDQDYVNKPSWLENWQFETTRFTKTGILEWTAEEWAEGGDCDLFPAYMGSDEGDANGMFFNDSNSYPTLSDYVSQEFGSDAVATSNILAFEFEYAFLNQSGGTASGYVFYIEVKANGGNYWLYDVDADYCDWNGSQDYVDLSVDIPVGNVKWTKVFFRVNGLPMAGPYTIKLFAGNAIANVWFGLRNVRFYETNDIIRGKITSNYLKDKVRRNRNYLGVVEGEYITEYFDVRDIVNNRYEKTNAINGEVKNLTVRLGDVVSSGIDNILEQFAGCISIRDKQARVDTITLTGSSGGANVTCNGITEVATFGDDLADTALDFVTAWAASYLPDVIVTNVSNDLVFTANTEGVEFSGDTAIDNLTGDLSGSVALTTPAYSWEGGNTWNTSGGSENKPLIEILAEELQSHYSRPREIIQLAIQEDFKYVTGADRAPQVSMIGRIEDSLNTFDGSARKLIPNAGEFNVIDRSWMIDVIEIV